MKAAIRKLNCVTGIGLIVSLTAFSDARAQSGGGIKVNENAVAFASRLIWEGHLIVDGKGAWRDNVFVERLWKSVKYEEVYLRAYETVGEARHSIGRYLDFYNGRRPHSSLDDMTPDQAYFNLPPLRVAA